MVGAAFAAMGGGLCVTLNSEFSIIDSKALTGFLGASGFDVTDSVDVEDGVMASAMGSNSDGAYAGLDVEVGEETVDGRELDTELPKKSISGSGSGRRCLLDLDNLGEIAPSKDSNDLGGVAIEAVGDGVGSPKSKRSFCG